LSTLPLANVVAGAAAERPNSALHEIPMTDPAPMPFVDLCPIAADVGDAGIAMPGERTHGGGSTFARRRIDIVIKDGKRVK
jgi:hypothetical protein